MPNKETQKKLKHIYQIWKEESVFGGHWIRHIDGNRAHNSIWNLALIHPHDAFANPDWVVDWDHPLTQAQIKIVRNNMSYLAERYDHPGFNTGIKGHAKITNPSMQPETVPVQQADKYKAHIASVWESICEKDPTMKNEPNEYRSVELQCQEVPSRS